MIISIPIVNLVTIVVGLLYGEESTRNCYQIRRDRCKISSSNLDEKIDIVGRRDELVSPCRDIQRHDWRLKDAFQRINQFSIDVSHELKTPSPY